LSIGRVDCFGRACRALRRAVQWRAALNPSTIRRQSPARHDAESAYCRRWSNHTSCAPPPRGASVFENHSPPIHFPSSIVAQPAVRPALNELLSDYSLAVPPFADLSPDARTYSPTDDIGISRCPGRLQMPFGLLGGAGELRIHRNKELAGECSLISNARAAPRRGRTYPDLRA
jgi:hypothetical protein